MLISEFDFSLPPELIAQSPLANREASRLLVVDREADTFTDRSFVDLVELLRAGDVLVLNNTRVFPARLVGRTETGAKVEIFLIEELESGFWKTLARPGRRLSEGKIVNFAHGLRATIAEKTAEGNVLVVFKNDTGDIDDIIDQIGLTPLPPYIKREDTAASDSDRERYQTVFAKSRGAVAAPTAGLHFTEPLIQSIKESGIAVAEITLHVGYGTFEPVRVSDLADHKVSPERYEIDVEAAAVLNEARSERRRIVAVGTTTTRALESNLANSSKFTHGRHVAELTITPGYNFHAVGALLTNFHLPKSSLLVLASTFGGRELIMSAYRHAVAERYRFYSYGDCMLIQ